MEQEHIHIDTLIVKYLDRSASIAEEDELLAWAQSSEENRKYYISQRKLHAHAHRHTPDKDDEAQLHSLLLRVGLKDNHRKMWISIAAAACILLVAGFWMMRPKSADVSQYAVQNEQLIHAEDSLNTQMLADGSQIWVAPGSEVATAGFTETARPLQMSGTAFYKVAKDSTRPFSIDAGFVRVVVLGTAFQIRQREADSSVTVSVSEGKVRVENLLLKTTVVIVAGEECVMHVSAPFVVRKLADENHLAWKTGVLQFNDSPLCEALVHLSDYFGKPFLMPADTIRNELLTARFDLASIEDVKSVLALALSVDVSESGDTILVSPKIVK